MDESEILKNLAKALGPEAENVFNNIKKTEDKKIKEQKILESFANVLGPEAQKIVDEDNEKRRLLEEKKEKEKRLLNELNNSLTKLISNNEEQIPVIEQEIVEVVATIQEDLQDLPQIPVDDIITPTVAALSAVPQKHVQQVADSIPASFRKELDILKKSIADLHRFAQRHSQMGGGGEVNLRYLDDVDRDSIFGGNFLKYNANSKKFEFANVTSNGVDWLHVPSDIIPNVNTYYSLGNSSMRWESLWVGGNSVTFSDQNPSYADQTLTVANGVFYITDSLFTKQQSDAGLRVGNFLLQNNYIQLTNTEATFYIGASVATGNLVINRPIAVKSYDTGNTTFAVSREGRVSIFTPTIPANDVGALNIIGSNNGAYQGVTNPGGMLHITGNDNVATRLTIDSFGVSGVPAIVGRDARGTAAAPTNTLANDVLIRVSGIGWTGGNNFTIPGVTVAPTALEAQAIENFSNTTLGSRWNLYTAPVGQTTRFLSLSVDANNVTIPNKLTVGSDTTINGNLVVTGSTLYANVENALIANLVLTLAYNSPTPALANGAGLLIDNTHVTWLYNYSANSWQSNVSIVPYFTDTYNIGSPTLRWNTLFAQTANVDIINANTIIVRNTGVEAANSILTVQGVTGTVPGYLSNGTTIHAVNRADTINRIGLDTYGNNVYNVVVGRTARGSITSPTAIANNDIMLRVSSTGYGTSGFTANSSARIDFVATEDFTDTNKGTKINFWATQNGNNSPTTVTSIEWDGIHLGHVYNPSGNVTNLHITGGANDQIMVSDGLGNFIWRDRHTDGTWTPVGIPATGSNIVFTSTVSTWTKIGPIVTCFFDANVSSMGTASGALKLNGLPFIAKDTGTVAGAVDIQAFFNMNTADCIRLSGTVDANTRSATMYNTKLNGQQIAFANLVSSDLKLNTRLIGIITYSTNF